MDNGFDKFTDEAFKDAFSDWEADFSPAEMQADWSQLSGKIGGASAGSAAAGKSASLLGGKALAIAGAAAVLTTSAVMVYNIYVSPASQPDAAVHNQNTTAATVPQAIERSVPVEQPQSTTAREAGITATLPAVGNRKVSKTYEEVESRITVGIDPFIAPSPGTAMADKGNAAATGLTPGGNQKANSLGGAIAETVVKRPVCTMLLSDSVICAGQAVRVSGIAPVIAENARISWGDAATAQYRDNLTHAYSRPGQYQIQLLSPAGSVQRTVQVMPAPQADFEAKDAENKTIRFRSTGHHADQAVWDFGDGTGLHAGEQSEHQYRDTGLYNVRLIASNSRGCTDTVERSLYVGDLKLYNVLTPDGDGMNDDWIIPVRNADYYELVVMDKSGRKVFETRDANVRWNGKVQNAGQACETGSYTYILRYRYAGQAELQLLQGTVRVQL